MAIINQFPSLLLALDIKHGTKIDGVRDSSSKNIPEQQLEQHAHCWCTDTTCLIVWFTYLGPIPPFSLNSNVPKT